MFQNYARTVDFYELTNSESIIAVITIKQLIYVHAKSIHAKYGT